MTRPSRWRRSGFEAVLRTELRVNMRRGVTPALAALCVGNAALWYFGGPAAMYGWARTSEFYTVRLLTGFTFFTLPLVAAVVTGDPVLRDADARVDALVHATPVTRGAYLLGKYVGSVAVLAGCATCYALALVLFQGLVPGGVPTSPAGVARLAAHFVVIVVVSCLPLSALYLAVGTLARNARMVYALAVSVYVLYGTWQTMVLARLPARWRVPLDPLMMRWMDAAAPRGTAPAVLDRLEFHYGPDIVGNRLAMVAVAAVCLAVLHWRFTPMTSGTPRRGSLFPAARPGRRAAGKSAAVRTPRSPVAERGRPARVVVPAQRAPRSPLARWLGQWAATTRVEWRLLRAERGLLIMCPLAAVLAAAQTLGVGPAGGAGATAAYAASLVPPLNLALFGTAVFLAGESVHRDRIARADALLWSTPVSESAVLAAKASAVGLLAVLLVALEVAVAATMQGARGHGPIDPAAYAVASVVVALPNAAFLVAASAACHVLAREKARGFLLCLGVSTVLYSLYLQGYTHPLLNPLLVGSVSPSDVGAPSGVPGWLVAHRAYVLALAALCAMLARHGLSRWRHERTGPTARGNA